jgi:hypothetical protein
MMIFIKKLRKIRGTTRDEIAIPLFLDVPGASLVVVVVVVDMPV